MFKVFRNLSKIFEIILQNFLKLIFLQILQHLQKKKLNVYRSCWIFQTDFLQNFWDCSGAEVCTSCRSWKMLWNANLLAKFRFDIAKNEPAKFLLKLPILINFAYPKFLTLSRPRGSGGRGGGGGLVEAAEGPEVEAARDRRLLVVERSRTRRVVANSWQIFGKLSLVFGCIRTNVCK